MLQITSTQAARRAAALIAAAGLATSLAACSSGTGGSSSDVTIAVVGPLAGDPYYLEVACGAQTKGKELGYNVQEQQAAQNQSQANQNTIVQNVLGTLPTALIYTPADPVAGGLPLKAAGEDVTVINVDAQLDDESLYESFIASNHYEGAREVTKNLIELIGGEGKIAALGSLPNLKLTQDRIAGFEDEVAQHPGVEVVSVSYPEINPEDIQAEAASLLVRYPDLKGFYTTNYLNSTGAAVAIRNAGAVGTVKMVSWDTGSANVKLLQEGVLQATVAQQPFRMGELAVEQIAKVLDGENADPIVEAPVSILTSENVDTPEGEALWYKGTCEQ